MNSVVFTTIFVVLLIASLVFSSYNERTTKDKEISTMFELLVFIFFIYLLITYWPLFIAGIIVLIIILIVRAVLSRSHDYTVTHEEPSESINYKIGAEVGNTLYYEVKHYCNRHNMTISDLVRKSVREYMKNHY